MSAKQFVDQLLLLKSKPELENVKRFFRDADKTKFIGVRMSAIFELAKKFDQMPLKEIDRLLKNDFYEVRMGAVSIMDFQARNKKISEEAKKELYELYLARHDRINNWDLVDRSAPFVIGGYLFDKQRKVLYQLAKSKNVWERRTAIVSTYFFIRQNEVEDTFKIAELLIHDNHDLIQKAVGSWVREAGKRDTTRLLEFLNKYAHAMPKVMLRYAVEKLNKKQKEKYLNGNK